MAYRLKRNEPLIEGLQRVTREEFAAAAQQLSRDSSANAARAHDRAIHEARKSVKKIRGVLRLIEPELGKHSKRASKTVGAIGRQLSIFRDSSAMITTVDALRKQYHSHLGQHTLQPVREALLQNKKEAEEQGNVHDLMVRLAQELTTAAADIENWSIDKHGFDAIAPGFKKTLRRGRKAYRAVCEHQRAENFHDWRKRVKDHWYHIRLLEPASKEELAPYQKSLRDLETWLGDDHNLAVLRQKIRAEPSLYGTREETELALDLIGQHQVALREKSLELGARLYLDKPGKVVEHMRELWEAWHTS